jgi:hypothetical protein
VSGSAPRLGGGGGSFCSAGLAACGTAMNTGLSGYVTIIGSLPPPPSEPDLGSLPPSPPSPTYV